MTVCGCVEVCRLDGWSDQFQPATRELMVFTKSKDRYFDLDAVREPLADSPGNRYVRKVSQLDGERRPDGSQSISTDNRITANYDPMKSAGAPPLDWWNIPIIEGEEPTRYGPKERVDTTRHLRADNKLNGREGDKEGFRNSPENSMGAPPLDWWNIPPGGYPGAHYAVWPPELLIKPIKAMCPESVCRVCGEPRRRIVKSANATDEREALADYLRERREAKGVTIKELAAHFPSVSGGVTGCVWNWENAANVPTAEQWPILKRLLALDDRFDVLVTGERAWTESLAEYEPHGDPARQNSEAYAQATMGQNPSAQGMPRGRATKIPKDAGFSDCGHDDWRPGLVLDPFGGSGTTAAVATGHGRDCVLVDLDERNYALALDRVGPLILELGLLPET